MKLLGNELGCLVSASEKTLFRQTSWSQLYCRPSEEKSTLSLFYWWNLWNGLKINPDRCNELRDWEFHFHLPRNILPLIVQGKYDTKRGKLVGNRGQRLWMPHLKPNSLKLGDNFLAIFFTYSMVKWACYIYYCVAFFLPVYNYDDSLLCLIGWSVWIGKSHSEFISSNSLTCFGSWLFQF